MNDDDTITRLLEVQAKLEISEKENRKLRYIIAKTNIPCLYCGLLDMSKCKSGFPGCARMDDIMVGGENEQ